MSIISPSWLPATAPSMMTQLAANSTRINNQINTLTEQSSTGLVSQDFAGLGSGAAQAISLQPQLASIDQFTTNINAASTQMQATQDALGQLNTIATSFISDLDGVTASSTSSLATLAQQAQAALSQVATVLNTNVAGSYIFGGADPTTPPIASGTALTSSNFVTQIQAAVAALGTGSGTAVATATQTSAIANAPALFNANMGSTPPTAEIDNGQYVATGVLANANLSGPQTGGTTTGSYVTDLLRALSTISGMGSLEVTQPGFQALSQDTLNTLQGAVSGISDDEALVGSNQDTLTNKTSVLADTKTLLTTQLSNITDVNMATTATQLSTAQSQLQASYQLIANMRDLSLTQYL